MAAGLPQVRTNAEAPASVLETIAQPDAQGTKLLRDAAETMRLSARGYHRVLRVARTLADLDGADKIGRLHLAEALSYRAPRKTCGAQREGAGYGLRSRAILTRRRRRRARRETDLLNRINLIHPSSPSSKNIPVPIRPKSLHLPSPSRPVPQRVSSFLRTKWDRHMTSMAWFLRNA